MTQINSLALSSRVYTTVVKGHTAVKMKAEPGQNRSVRALSVATTGSEVHRYGNVKGAETSPAVFDVAGMPICSHPLINQSTAQSQEITILAQDYFVACDDTNKCDAAVAGGEQEIAQDITNIRNAVNESIHKPAKLRLNSLYTRFSSPKYLIEIHIFLVWFYQGIRQIINRFSTLFWATSITYWQKRIVSSHPFVLLLACSLSFVERTWPPKTEDPPKTHRQAAISTSEPPTTLHRDLLRVDIEDLSRSSTPTAPLPGTQSQNLPQNKLSGLGLQKNENQTHPCRICHKGFHFNQLFKHLEDSHSYVRSQVNATEISPLQKSPGLSCACGFRGRSVKPNFGRCQLVQASWRVQNGQEIGVWSAEKGQSPALSFQCTSPTGTFCPFSRPSKRDYEHPRHDDIAVGVLLWVKKRDSYPTSRRYLCANKHDSPCLLDPHKSQGHPAVVLDYRRRSGSDVVGDLELLMCPVRQIP